MDGPRCDLGREHSWYRPFVPRRRKSRCQSQRSWSRAVVRICMGLTGCSSGRMGHNAGMLKPRLLLIEDSVHRIEAFTEWLAGSEFVLIVCRSGGQAMGMLSRGGAEAIAGLMLDHDLTDSTITVADLHLSTTNVLPLIVASIRRDTPVLIHSHNPGQATKMCRRLEAARMSVTRTPFAKLTQRTFYQWLEEVRDFWDAETT